MACQDASLDALIAYYATNGTTASPYLQMLICARVGALPVDCLAAAGLSALRS
tara:strand:- start:1259 stop:1417 length:159 start_codon:yes stop_codon:yes gene_type:complete